MKSVFRTMRLRILFLIGVAVLIASAAVVFRPASVPPECHTPHEVALKDNGVEYKERWKRCVVKVGAEDAYRYFSETMRLAEHTDQHMFTHYFAHGLYEADGIESIRVCDEAFSQGCMHEMMGRAVEEYGPSSSDVILKTCRSIFKEKSFFCYHGIGHGLMYSLGDGTEALRTAVDRCEAISKEDPLDGCYTGLYMEYFLRNISLAGDWPRPVEGSIYGPCMEIRPKIGRYMCWSSLSRWWHQLGAHDGDSQEHTAVLMGRRCAALPDIGIRKMCFSGVGRMVPVMAEYVTSESKRLCALAATDDAVMLTACLSRAANATLLDKLPLEAMRVCGDLEGDRRRYCEAYAKDLFYKNIRLPLPGFGVEDLNAD